jgi:hypothetical protein
MKKEVVQAVIHDDMALVISKGQNTGIYKDEAFNVETWVTNIYKRKGKGWICIMTQESPVKC